MKWDPDKYQLKALSFLLSKPLSGLFIDPGFGKTSVILKYLCILQHLLKSKPKMLMISTLQSASQTWEEEVNKWDDFKHFKICLLHGKDKNKLWGDYDIFCINGEGVKWLYFELLDKLKSGKKLPFNIILIDECTIVKNKKSKLFDYVQDLTNLFKIRHIMTGTPMPTSYLDLWAQIYVLDKGKALGEDYYQFVNKYFYKVNRYSYKIFPWAKDEIKRKIKHLILDISDEVLNLPNIIEYDLTIKLPKKLQFKYNELQNDLVLLLENKETIDAKNTADSLSKCHQFCNGHIYKIEEDLTRTIKHIHNLKEKELRKLINKHYNNQFIILYRFKHDLISIKNVIGDNYHTINSKQTKEENRRVKNKWNNKEITYLVANPKSIAHSLNLQKGGNKIICFSVFWEYELYNQVIRRIRRRGAINDAHIYRIVCLNTIDMLMINRLKSNENEETNLRKYLRNHLKIIKT